MNIWAIWKIGNFGIYEHFEDCYNTNIFCVFSYSGTTQNTNSEYGSFNASQDRATPSIVSSELTLLESPSSEMLNQAQATTSFNNENELKTNSIPSQR